MDSGGEGTPADGFLRVRLVVRPDPELDPAAVERLTRQVRAEITQLDVESVALAPGEAAPAGAKGSDPVTLGALVVAMSASGGVFTALIDTLRDWLGRHSGRHRIAVTIDGDSIELDRATNAQQRQLVEAYLRRHVVE
jgi:membrane-associated two-gene conflict system component 1 (EACC1)